MTELSFKGKEFVYNHHLAVPFRPLVPHPEKGIGPVALDGNLVIHGDNLHALKALLPLYAGKVDCIFIDPPYNTGNEGWCYNDNVNAPMIREWLESNPIGIEDGLRHDKWCAMMWPRLRLLWELLADHGSIWITLDDNEAHRAKMLLDEIFGENCFVSNIVWQKRYVANVTAIAIHVSDMHDHMFVYAKNPSVFKLGKLGRSEEQAADYKNPDNDPRGPWRAQDLSASKPYQAGIFTIAGLDGAEFDPPPRRYWRMNRTQYEAWLADGRITFGATGRGRPMLKRFLSEAQNGLTPVTWWEHAFAGHNKEATLEMKAIFGGESPFDNPKPKRLVDRVLELLADEDLVVLDSFAGSATTAHAVLSANARDCGKRRFILVEMEDYADKLTAERVRRVIDGYEFKGTLRTELFRNRLNWRAICDAGDLIQGVEAIESLHEHEYDRIKKEVRDSVLIITGEKTVDERAEGLGGSFTYCTLGEPVELDKVLSGETLPSYEGLGAALFHMATSHALDPVKVQDADFYLGAVAGQHVWLIYKPDLDWLKSPEAALTLARAKQFAATAPDARHLVIAPARFVSQKMLAEQNVPVDFVPLPFALYRIERS